MFSLLIPYLAPFFDIFHPRHQITGGNITYIHSTHTSHAGRDATRDRCHDESAISTHTPHARRDCVSACRDYVLDISTHTPHAERDSGSVYSFTSALPFLLTRPMRCATIGSGSVINGVFNFYSHASCEARQLHIVYVTLAPPIYKRRTQKL